MSDDEAKEPFADNPNCENTHVTLRFVHAELDPDIITQRLGLQPDEAHRKGDMRQGSQGRTYRYPNGSWKLTTRGCTSRNLEAHLIRVLDRVAPVAHVVVAFRQSHPEYRFEIMCYWMSATGQGGPSISPATLGRIAALGATLDFDIYSAV